MTLLGNKPDGEVLIGAASGTKALRQDPRSAAVVGDTLDITTREFIRVKEAYFTSGRGDGS